jgi:hypothetical protein
MFDLIVFLVVALVLLRIVLSVRGAVVMRSFRKTLVEAAPRFEVLGEEMDRANHLLALAADRLERFPSVPARDSVRGSIETYLLEDLSPAGTAAWKDFATAWARIEPHLATETLWRARVFTGSRDRARTTGIVYKRCGFREALAYSADEDSDTDERLFEPTKDPFSEKAAGQADPLSSHTLVYTC